MARRSPLEELFARLDRDRLNAALSLRITGRAAAEIGRADAWWRENRSAAGFV